MSEVRSLRIPTPHVFGQASCGGEGVSFLSQPGAVLELAEFAGVEIFFPIVTASDGKRTFAVKDLEGDIIQFFGK
jgi:hypothetical protein